MFKALVFCAMMNPQEYFNKSMKTYAGNTFNSRVLKDTFVLLTWQRKENSKWYFCSGLLVSQIFSPGIILKVNSHTVKHW